MEIRLFRTVKGYRRVDILRNSGIREELNVFSTHSKINEYQFKKRAEIWSGWRMTLIFWTLGNRTVAYTMCTVRGNEGLGFSTIQYQISVNASSITKYCVFPR